MTGEGARPVIALRLATPEDLPTLSHWDQQPHVIAADYREDAPPGGGRQVGIRSAAMDKIESVSLHARLLTERQALLDLHAVSASTREAVQLDQTAVGRLSRMDALQGQAMAQATARHRAERVRAIDAALRRIETGDYGWCEGCGETIDRRRLAVDPTFTQCVRCAA